MLTFVCGCQQRRREWVRESGLAFAALVMLCRSTKALTPHPWRSCHALYSSRLPRPYSLSLLTMTLFESFRFAPSLGQLPHAAATRDSNHCRPPSSAIRNVGGNNRLRGSKGGLWNARVRVDVSEISSQMAFVALE